MLPAEAGKTVPPDILQQSLLLIALQPAAMFPEGFLRPAEIPMQNTVDKPDHPRGLPCFL
jgi:hypothetical protein